MNKLFKKHAKKTAIGLGLTAAMMGVSFPSMAGTDFHQEDLQHKETEFVQALARIHSEEKLSFLVHVGEEKMASAVYQVASYFDDQGDDVAYFMAPDIDDIPNTTYVEIIKDGIAYGLVGLAHQDIGKFQQAVFEEAVKVKNEASLAKVDAPKEENPSLISGLAYNN